MKENRSLLYASARTFSATGMSHVGNQGNNTSYTSPAGSALVTRRALRSGQDEIPGQKSCVMAGD